MGLHTVDSLSTNHLNKCTWIALRSSISLLADIFILCHVGIHSHYLMHGYVNMMLKFSISGCLKYPHFKCIGA